MASKTFSELNLKGLRLPVHIGHTAAERVHAQDVLFDLRVSFRNLPPACLTDRLEDTVCYAELAELLKQTCAAKEYALIEHLAHEALQKLKERTPTRARIALTVTKVQPPIESLEGGAGFTIVEEDEP